MNARSVRINSMLLRQLRIDRGLTQRELAKLAGYSERLIRKAETGGCLSIETIQNIAEALVGEDGQATVQRLSLDILTVAKQWVTAFDTLGQGMVPHVKHHLATDFIFVCPGDPTVAPFIGTWHGADGLQQWLDRFFGVFRRRPLTDATFAVGENSVHARFWESGYIGEQLCGPIRINMHFQFNDEGLIRRIDDDYDTQAGANNVTAAKRLNEP
jgi:DNA-binding XRE family transcriptional regulator